MKTKLILFVILLSVSYSAYPQSTEGIFICGNEEDEHEHYSNLVSTRSGSSLSFYNNINNWIPYMDEGKPLQCSPIKVIEMSFHVFLDDNGGNNVYTDDQNGRQRLIRVLDVANKIYAGESIGFPIGPSDPIDGVVELPGYDTRVRLSLGDNNERIYFYRESFLNQNSRPTSSFNNYISSNFPERTGKMNVYFTASHRNAKVKQDSIIITNPGNGYTSIPTVTFRNNEGNTSNTAAVATAVITNQKLTAITLISEGGYYQYNPPQIVIEGGGGFGASAIVTGLSGGATGEGPGDIIYMYMCHNANSFAYNDNFQGRALAHELGHNLKLNHTFSSAECYCNRSPDNFFYDIYGDPCPGNCPHIQTWADPFNETLENHDRITNNMMGYTQIASYISPQQAGKIHRSLSREDVKKYVKQETYSDIPLVISNDEIWDFDLKLYRDIVVSSDATLTIANTFTLPYNGTITVEDGAALVIERGITLLGNNKIVVKSGGTIKIASDSRVNISNDGYIQVEEGGFICIESGSDIRLNDPASVIYIDEFAELGSGKANIPESTCISKISNITYTGSGKVVDGSRDIYIFDTIISSNCYFGGRRIYVSQYPPGEEYISPINGVTITNNAHVIFEGKEVFFDTGFECQKGSTFEVR